jgi:hypothetical protein
MHGLWAVVAYHVSSNLHSLGARHKNVGLHLFARFYQNQSVRQACVSSDGLEVGFNL